jgi:mannose-1-phosphate guanylyltransferase / mannose-6-phosphate isomerase
VIKSIILCGGGGTRLWPMSREAFPKQFLPLASDKSLLVDTILRLAPADDSTAIESSVTDSGANTHSALLATHVFFSCGQALGRQLAEHLAVHSLEALCGNILVEPSARNTAPAIVLAVLNLLHQGALTMDEPVAILPADHHIGQPEVFQQALALAAEQAKAGWIATLGIPPDYPETGYGYIALEQPLAPHAELAAYPVVRFEEKPSKSVAEGYVSSQRYLWNAGVFVLTPATLLKALAAHAPALAHIAEQGYLVANDRFTDMPKISFDYAVMEHFAQVSVVPLVAQWRDLGSWDSVHAFQATNAEAATTPTTPLPDVQTDNYAGHVVSVGSSGCMVMGPAQRTIALLGMTDCYVVDTPDALLIGQLGHGQSVKDIQVQLQPTHAACLQTPSFMRFAWGQHKLLTSTTGVTVYEWTLNPNALLADALASQQLDASTQDLSSVTLVAGSATQNGRAIELGQSLVGNTQPLMAGEAGATLIVMVTSTIFIDTANVTATLKTPV